MPINSPLDAIAGIAALWACSVVALTWSIVVVTKRVVRNLGRLRGLGGEEGFAYPLGFILTMPFLMLMVALVVESTLLLASIAGTFHAAFAAARSAIVWETAQPAGIAGEKARSAAVHAIAPFASSNPAHLAGGAGSSADDADYIAAYHAYSPSGPLGDGYLANKLAYARQAIAVSYEPPATWDADITVNVTYEHPFSIGLIGRCLGHVAPWGGCYSYTIQMPATLQNEGPKNDAQSLGIRYESDE